MAIQQTAEQALNFQAQPKKDIFKVGEGEEYKVLFYGGVESILVYRQHEFFKSRPGIAKNEKQPIVAQDIVFECVKNDFNDPDHVCPGCAVGVPVEWYAQKRYIAPIMVDGNPEPQIFYLKGQLWKIFENVWVNAVEKNNDLLKRTWVKISNSGKPNWYSGSAMLQQYQGDLPEVLDVRPFIKPTDVYDVARKLHTEGLLTDEQLEMYTPTGVNVSEVA